MGEFWEENLVLRVLAGSRAYGLDHPGSDRDTRGVCIPPLRCLMGLERFEQHESPGSDHVVYALEKFSRLALQGNPNLLEVLFTEGEALLHCDRYGRRLREHRHLFLSRRVGRSFGGYAVDQLKKMERRYRWLTRPPERKPEPEDFGAWTVQGSVRFPDTRREQEYRGALRHWQQYETWLKDRNPARAGAEARFGYDTKDAMHLMRLLRMAKEILVEGEVRVRRADADWLKGVRQGALPYAEVLEIARRAEAELPELTESSDLPEEPDREAVEDLVMQMQWDFHRERRG